MEKNNYSEAFQTSDFEEAELIRSEYQKEILDMIIQDSPELSDYTDNVRGNIQLMQIFGSPRSLRIASLLTFSYDIAINLYDVNNYYKNEEYFKYLSIDEHSKLMKIDLQTEVLIKKNITEEDKGNLLKVIDKIMPGEGLNFEDESVVNEEVEAKKISIEQFDRYTKIMDSLNKTIGEELKHFQEDHEEEYKALVQYLRSYIYFDSLGEANDWFMDLQKKKYTTIAEYATTIGMPLQTINDIISTNLALLKK